MISGRSDEYVSARRIMGISLVSSIQGCLLKDNPIKRINFYKVCDMPIQLKLHSWNMQFYVKRFQFCLTKPLRFPGYQQSEPNYLHTTVPRAIQPWNFFIIPSITIKSVGLSISPWCSPTFTANFTFYTKYCTLTLIPEKLHNFIITCTSHSSTPFFKYVSAQQTNSLCLLPKALSKYTYTKYRWFSSPRASYYTFLYQNWPPTPTSTTTQPHTCCHSFPQKGSWCQ